MATRLAGLGAHVVVCDIDADGAARMADRIGGEALVIDLSRTADLAELVLEADVLVNNAGVQHVAPVERFEADRFAFMLRLMPDALEDAAKGVTSNCVCPGYVRTPMVEHQLADEAAKYPGPTQDRPASS